jgi:hypothetical protein
VRTVIATLLIALLILVLGAGIVIYSGVYDVAATAPHWPATAWLLETARARSIKALAAGIAVPPGLDDPAKIIIGVEHYAAHCAVCHGAPGVPRATLRRVFIRHRRILPRPHRSTPPPSFSGSLSTASN